MAKGRPRAKSEYGLQLAEKQGIRNQYGLRERQFKNYFNKGKTPNGIFVLLETRLDNVVFRSGIAATRRMARQMVSHGHITVNGRKARIASRRLNKGDILAVREQSKQKGMFEDYKLRVKNHEPPRWLSVDSKKMEAKIVSLPDLKESPQPVDLQTVVEFYSR